MLTVTHPGKLGDLLWALPTVRTLSRLHRMKACLWLAPTCQPLVALLEEQPYISSVCLDETWQVRDTAPATPNQPSREFPGTVYHLGYVAWPTKPLPFYIESAFIGEPASDWSPWVDVSPVGLPVDVFFHFTDRWFELKVGLLELVTSRLNVRYRVGYAPEGRWDTEYNLGQPYQFLGLARRLVHTKLVVTDNSAVMVLAAAMGVRSVIVEPESDRHHFIFWPGSTQTPEGHWVQADNPFGDLIWPVLGTDRRPTFDARHTLDLILELLK